MNSKEILITGGTGMVGTSLKYILPDAIYISSKDYDLTDEYEVKEMFAKFKPKKVVHLAAKVGGIIDNINHPHDYFIDNIKMNTFMVEQSFKNNVSQFIGVLSTCIYPDIVSQYPMTEKDLHLGPPTITNLPYGYSKRALAVQIDALNKQHNTQYQYLTPCNLYGEHDKMGHNSHYVAALLQKIIKCEEEKAGEITLFGTGKPLRQFMHSDDLAWVIHECLSKEIYESFNVATNRNLSIKEMADIALKALDLEHIKIKFDITKPDGQFRKDVSTEKLYSILPNFNPLILEKGIKLVYDKLSKRYNR
jgi:GDP-L-fucose synthase